MSRIYVGNLEPRITERNLDDEFRVYGVIKCIWVARRRPGFAFIDFDDRRDAEDAIRDMDGKHGWRVELSHRSAEGRGVGGRGRDYYGSSDLKCYKCGEPGHFARECRLTIGSGGLGSGRHRSPSPRFRRSPSYGRSPSPRFRRSPSYGRSPSPRFRRSPSYGRRSYSPRDWSPRRRNSSSRRGRSYSRSPPYPNGRNGAANGRR